MRFFYCAILLFLCNAPVFSQRKDSTVVRRVPAMGITLDSIDENELRVELKVLSNAIVRLKLKQDTFTKELLPDIMIYYKAVDYALTYNEFFSLKDITAAKELLKSGQHRATELLHGNAPWTTAKGEVVRGYISKIDQSVQPYGLSIPAEYEPNGTDFNLSLWFHGRGENLSELNFIANGKGFFPRMPEMKQTIMLYPYGRYCNGFKFAGEVDVLEALEHVKGQYRINENGLFNRGFSMGGAAVWHFAVHYPDLWLAANPGAGFAETTEFLLLDKETLRPAWYEKKLLHLYDCTDYPSNLSSLPIIAYNGDKDLQKQAADVMERAMKTEGLALTRVVGPNTGHSYNPSAARTVDSLLHLIAVSEKKPPPAEVHFTTYTLKYNKMYWVTVNALKAHWQMARVDGSIRNQTISLKTTNVSALSLDATVLSTLIDLKKPFVVNIDHKQIRVEAVANQSKINFCFENKHWVTGLAKPVLSKVHNLQGPIDDAFMSAFIVVKPTGSSRNKLFDRWSKLELNRFIDLWRRQFRGDAVVKNDVDITTVDLSSNLILFGDEESSSVIAKIKNKLPIKWNLEQIRLGDSTYSSTDHALIMIYPNPLNPLKYIVLNSGFTFREESFLNNAKQIPMLPDWAIIDLNMPPGPVHPGKISRAGFFGEAWEYNILTK